MVPVSNDFGLTRCTVCQAVLSRKAHFCPQCGDPKKALPVQRPFEIPALFQLVAMLYLIIGIVLCLGFGITVMDYLSRH